MRLLQPFLALVPVHVGRARIRLAIDVILGGGDEDDIATDGNRPSKPVANRSVGSKELSFLAPFPARVAINICGASAVASLARPDNGDISINGNG